MSLTWKDMEMLLHAQAKADKDPLGFVEALKKGVSDQSNIPT